MGYEHTHPGYVCIRAADRDHSVKFCRWPLDLLRGSQRSMKVIANPLADVLVGRDPSTTRYTVVMICSTVESNELAEIGLTRCDSKPASRVRRTSSSIPKPLITMPR